MVISKAFCKPAQGAPLAGSVTMLEVPRAAVVRQLAVLEDAGRAAAGQSLVEVLGIPGAVLAEKLTGHLVREIMLRGSGGGPLAPLADQLNHDLTHLQGQRVEGMLARLVALVMTASASLADPGGLARGVGPARPPKAVWVSETDPRRLGVHAAISVPGVSDEIPPESVLRDTDDGEFGVRAKVAAAARRGGFVLLVGGSSVGKTRCAFEAVGALLPDWWLVHPAGSAEVAALAAAPSPRMVVWLDELQRFLGKEHGLTAWRGAGAARRPRPDRDHHDAVAGPVQRLHRCACAWRRGPACPGARSAGPGRGHPQGLPSVMRLWLKKVCAGGSDGAKRAGLPGCCTA